MAGSAKEEESVKDIDIDRFIVSFVLSKATPVGPLTENETQLAKDVGDLFLDAPCWFDYVISKEDVDEVGQTSKTYR